MPVQICTFYIAGLWAPKLGSGQTCSCFYCCCGKPEGEILVLFRQKCLFVTMMVQLWVCGGVSGALLQRSASCEIHNQLVCQQVCLNCHCGYFQAAYQRWKAEASRCCGGKADRKTSTALLLSLMWRVREEPFDYIKSRWVDRAQNARTLAFGWSLLCCSNCFWLKPACGGRCWIFSLPHVSLHWDCLNEVGWRCCPISSYCHQNMPLHRRRIQHLCFLQTMQTGLIVKGGYGGLFDETKDWLYATCCVERLAILSCNISYL